MDSQLLIAVRVCLFVVVFFCFFCLLVFFVVFLFFSVYDIYMPFYFYIYGI